MKINKFKEATNQEKWKPTDKLYKVVINETFYVPVDHIKEYETNIKDGIKSYISDNGLGRDFIYYLVDGDLKSIENEKEFDNFVNDIDNYNL